jgi:hypothetical protein
VIEDTYGLERYPWERLDQDGETSHAYRAFLIYRDAGPKRTLRAVAHDFYDIPRTENLHADHAGKIRTVEKWSAQFRWVQRAEEFDDWLQKQADADDIQAIKDMRKRHVQLASSFQAKVVTYLNGMDNAALARMNPDQMMRVLDLAIKNERLARGVPDQMSMQMIMDAGRPADRADASAEALQRKLDAWLMSVDPENDIERGEPAREAVSDLPDAPADPAAASTVDDDLLAPPAWGWDEEQGNDENPT